MINLQEKGTGTQLQKPPSLRPLILLYLVIILCTVLAGIAYYNYQKENILSEEIQKLSAISDLKIRQISQWRIERIADARFLGENVMLGPGVPEYFSTKNDEKFGLIVKKALKSLVESFDYHSAAVLERTGSVRIAYPSNSGESFSHPELFLPGLARERRVVMTDFVTRTDGDTHLDMIVPLSGDQVGDTTVSGYLLLRIDPSKVLFPLLRVWPVPAKSAETVIVRKEGGNLICLSELRGKPAQDKKLIKSFSADNKNSESAASDLQGNIDGIDYQNVRVIATAKKIPGTNWFMVAKIDRTEALSDLKSQARIVFMALILFIFTVGLMLGFVHWNQRVIFYREKYEEELSRLALFSHFDYILKFANDIILLLDRNLNVIEANDKALETYITNREDFIGTNIKLYQAPETVNDFDGQINEVFQVGSATFETSQHKNDGSEFPVEISARLVDIEGDSYIQIIGRDITERHSSEVNLRESELRFRKIFEESPFPMVITAKDFGILRANESFCTMSGYTEEELKLHTMSELTHPDDATGVQLNLMKLIAGEESVYQAEKHYIRKNGSLILGSTTISVVRDIRDTAQIFICMIEDITRKKQAEQELVAAKLKAEESDRLKTAFLHNVSHEIRTPMNAIIGFSSLLHEPDISEPDRQQYTEIIFQSSGQLLSIINDIVDVANIESGQVIVNTSDTDLNFALRNLSEQYGINKTRHHIPVNLKLGLIDEKARIKTDPTKLIQVLSNLINNSLKFTQIGRVDFGYNLKNGSLEFYVNDTGIGIPAESIPKIFDRFYQVDRTVSRQFGGTGLGLSICKAYVHLLGGEISVTSTPGKGTKFVFTIPYVQAASAV